MNAPNIPSQTTISTRQLAEILGVTPRTIRRLVRNGRLPALRLGRVLRFERNAVDALKEHPAGRE